MNKNDVRVRFTRSAILGAFMKLIKEKPIEKISVTELCRSAGINRGTFYKHYLDIYNVLEQLEDDAVTSLRNSLENKAYSDLKGYLVYLLEFIKEYGDLYTVLASADPAFMKKIIDVIRETAGEDFIRNRGSSMKDRYLFLFVSEGCSAVLREWMECGMKEDPAETADCIYRFVIRAVRH